MPRLSLSLLILTAMILPLSARADTPAPDDPLRVFAARRLDDAGRLSDALPLYEVRARQTSTQADRLRYAGALLRAGRADDARAVLDQLVSEEGSLEHGAGARLRAPAVCASAAISAGFPDVAVVYARTAVERAPRDAGARLLLVRALAASGDVDTARPILRDLAAEGVTGDG